MKRLLVVLLLAALSTHAQAQTSLWKISSDNHALFLGGTIHLLAKADFPLPEPYFRAFQTADQLVLEADTRAMGTPDFQQEMLTAVTYLDGSTIKSILKPATYQALESYCQSRGLSVDSLGIYKPGMLALTLTVLELQRLGMAEAGVDQYFMSQAIQSGKALSYLETADEQLGFMAALGNGYEDEIILQTLQEMEELPEIMSQMKRAWRHGDSRSLNTLVINDMKKDYPEVYKMLITKRNQAWVLRIEAMLETRDIEMVLVGAAHLVGNDGVIQLLQDRGYSVEQW